MSPREIYREMEAANVRRKDEADAQRAAAWWTAKYTAQALAGKLPALDQELDRVVDKPQPAKQSKQQMAAMVRILAAQYGQPIRHTH